MTEAQREQRRYALAISGGMYSAMQKDIQPRVAEIRGDKMIMKTGKESMLCTEIKNQIEPFIASADGCAYNEEEVEKAILLAFEKGKKETEEQAWKYYREKLKQSEELNEIKKQWHDCFLSCSSPFCAAHFPAVEMQGELGNMSKREPEAQK